MQAQSAGRALARLPVRARTLVASSGAVWIWPGIALTVRRGAEIVPVADATIRFWIALLHGPEALHKELSWSVSAAARCLRAGDETTAQRALDVLGLSRLSQEGAAFEALLFAQPSLLDRLVKAGPWDSSKHPRWPAGAPESQGGRFAPSDSPGEPPSLSEPPPDLPPLVVYARKRPTIGHNQGPPLEEPPEIPQEPLRGSARTVFIKLAVKWLATALEISDPEARLFLGLLQASSWIAEQCYPYIAAYFTPPKTLDELQDDTKYPAKGCEIHHVVEKAQAAVDGIPASVWNAPENRVRIPTLKHWEITGWYMTQDEEYGGLSPRNYLKGKSWNEKIRVGRRALILFGVLKP